ncbi:hypothetical protein PV326_001837, partial [Microctonus aethiopoides]
NNVQRVPRALVLQPVIKVKTKDDDEGPFDFISDFLLRIINPPKKIPSQTQQQKPPMLGPLRVPGINDEVYVKQLHAMEHHNGHVVIQVPNMDSNNVPMSMPLGINGYNYQKSNYPMNSARQVPMQTGGFHPVPSPTSNPSWSPSITSQSHMPAYGNNIHESPNSIKNGYKNYPNYYRNFRNVPVHSNDMQNQMNQQNYYNRYQNQWQPQQYYPQYPSSHQQFYSPYNSHHRPQTDYRPYDYHNSIPGNNVGFTNYGLDSPRSQNYTRHSEIKHQEDTDDTTAIEENEAEKDEEINLVNLRENVQATDQTKYKHNDLPRANPTSAKASTNPSELIEIYRSDRMVPTNPTYRNRFWTRTTSKITAKVSSTTEHFNADQAEESSKKEIKYSSRGIEEIPAPDLKSWNDSVKRENNPDQSSDSRMDDEDGIIMKDGTTLGKGESHEYVDDGNTMQLRLTEEPLKNISSMLTSRNSRNWKPIEMSKRNEDYLVKGNLTIVENATPDVLEKVMSLTDSNSRRHNDGKKPNKIKFPRLKNSKNRRVRIVESVKSSVSMTSSRAFFIAMLVVYKPSEGKKVVIHVPYHVKNVKHTHTIYKMLPQSHLAKKDDSVDDDDEEFDHFKK